MARSEVKWNSKQVFKEVVVTESFTATGSATFSAGTITVATLPRLVTPTQAIDMADATHALILTGTAGAGQTLVTKSFLVVTPNSAGSTEILKLPPEADGLLFVIFNAAGDSDTITLQDDAGGSIATIAAGKAALVFCNGTNWATLAGA